MKSVLFSALLISVIAVASALECYQCIGLSDCRDPFDTTGKETCSSTGLIPYTHCLKIVAGDTVTRSCGIACTAGASCCTTDLCNGGNTVTTSFVAMGVALVAAFIFSRQ